MRNSRTGALCCLGLTSVCLLTLSGCSQVRVTLQGTGATFPAPIYKRWFQEYNRLHPDVQINYQATGSGAGKRQFTEGLVDFGASDAAMTDDEIKKVSGEVLLLPLTAGSIVLAYNVKGAGDGLKLSREVYAGIFLGTITHWDDDKITALNPDRNLPHQTINVVRRAEGSGTTFVFTQHLSTISPEWKKGPGTGQVVDWPVGIGGKNNAGVAALIRQTPGAIGYLEFQYAKATKLDTAALQNKAGKYIQADPETSAASLASVQLPANFRIWVPDPEGEKCYPIVTYTWLLLHKNYQDQATAETLKDVLRYCLTDGQKISEELGYIPLPAPTAKAALQAVETLKP
jgi:phosphate transport system substrate-binding protein